MNFWWRGGNRREPEGEVRKLSHAGTPLNEWVNWWRSQNAFPFVDELMNAVDERDDPTNVAQRRTKTVPLAQMPIPVVTLQ